MKNLLIKYYFVFISSLVLFDQVVKIIIDWKYRDVIFNIIPNIIIYKPVFNDKFSWVNSTLNIGLGRGIHIVLMVLIGVLVLLAFNYIRAVKGDSNSVLIGFMFLISGLICSTIDKIFWGGSLDFIRLKGFFTFDIKDCYVSIAEVTFMIVIIINWKKVNSFKVKQFYEYIISLIRG